MSLKHLDLFSGIGGFALAARNVGGIETVAFCEIDPFCRAVLAKHWPGVPCHEDVRKLDGAAYRGIDILTGGVPCQPASVAGKRKGSSDERWLWPDFLRVVREARPVWVLAENPLGIVSLKPHGVAWITSELEAEGYETCVYQVGADDVGAPHRRKRVWIVGHLVNADNIGRNAPERQATKSDNTVPHGADGGCRKLADTDGPNISLSEASRQNGTRTTFAGAGQTVADAANVRCKRLPPLARETHGSKNERRMRESTGGHTRQLADAEHDGCRARGREQSDEGCEGIGRGESARGVQLADANGSRRGASRFAECRNDDTYTRWPSRPDEPQHEWEAPRLTQFDVGDTVNGLPVRLARSANKHALRALGNAVVPQVAEIILRGIVTAAANNATSHPPHPRRVSITLAAGARRR